MATAASGVQISNPQPPGGPDLGPAAAPLAAAALARNGNGRPYIMLTRPVSELGAHIRHCELPSWGLVARVIKTLALFIFTWHLCDDILLPSDDGRLYNVIYNRREGGVGATWWVALHNSYPHMQQKAWKLTPTQELRDPGRVMAHNEFPELNAQAVCDYFSYHHGVMLTNKVNGNTLYNLAYSQFLRPHRG